MQPLSQIGSSALTSSVTTRAKPLASSAARIARSCGGVPFRFRLINCRQGHLAPRDRCSTLVGVGKGNQSEYQTGPCRCRGWWPDAMMPPGSKGAHLPGHWSSFVLGCWSPREVRGAACSRSPATRRRCCCSGPPGNPHVGHLTAGAIHPLCVLGLTYPMLSSIGLDDSSSGRVLLHARDRPW